MFYDEKQTPPHENHTLRRKAAGREARRFWMDPWKIKFNAPQPIHQLLHTWETEFAAQHEACNNFWSDNIVVRDEAVLSFLSSNCLEHRFTEAQTYAMGAVDEAVLLLTLCQRLRPCASAIVGKMFYPRALSWRDFRHLQLNPKDDQFVGEGSLPSGFKSCEAEEEKKNIHQCLSFGFHVQSLTDKETVFQ